MSNRIPGTKFVRAGELPASFAIPTTFHRGGNATAVRTGHKVRVTFLGHSVLLPRSARVRVITASIVSKPTVRKAA